MVPTYFRASCFDASRGEGGGYFAVERTLAGSLGSEIPYELEDDEWQSEVERLEEFMAAAAWSWLRAHYPRCMALVPSRRKERFLAGVRDAYHDEGFGF
jgi:hypothetical protein